MSRSNLLINTYGGTNASNKWTGWTPANAALGGTVTYGIVDGWYSTTGQRIAYTGVAGDATASTYFERGSAVGSFSPGDSATSSLYIKGSATGVTATIYVLAFTAANGFINSVTQVVTPTADWQRVSVTYSSLPATTSYCRLRLTMSAIAEGDAFDITFDAAQLERRESMTGYIPTLATVETVESTGFLTAIGVL